MITFPNCKINLGLHITRRREDGFHELETVFYPLPLHDALEIIPAPDHTTAFSSSGISIPDDMQKNLCEKAYDLIAGDFSIPAVKIHLHKSIPTGAGLGGGSADASFTLIMLNEMFNLKLDAERLKAYAAQLGSDCSFFIHNEPCFAKGRGEIISPFPMQLTGKYMVLIKPEVHVSTKDAFAGITPIQPMHNLQDVLHLPIDQWKDKLVNDFEQSVFSKYPQIGNIKKELYTMGAQYAAMSGSGASLYGIFDRKPNFNIKARFKDCFIWQNSL